MINLNVPYLSDAYIASVACSFLKENSLASIPINIERVIESNYRMDIVPLPGLQNAFDVVGFSSSDCTVIYVDDFVYKQRYFRYRFTLAHELGHKVIHHKYLSKLKFSSIAEWTKVIDQLDPWDYEKMEYQAYTFAGLVLVPPEFLKTEFNKQLHILEPQIEQAQSKGINRDDYVHTVLDGIAYGLSPIFKVSTDVLSRRIGFECLEQEIR